MRVTESKSLIFVTLLLFALSSLTAHAQTNQQPPPRSTSPDNSRKVSLAQSVLTGVYRINIESSDKLYSVVESATSNLPFKEQQRFFIDLAVRLTPPDLLAIERSGRTISIASSRAPRITFEADGVTQRERSTGNRMVRTRATLFGERLTVNTSGSQDDSFAVTFDPIDGGRRLRVTRRINAAQLNEPVVVESIYDKISEVAEWNIAGERDATPAGRAAVSSNPVRSSNAKVQSDEAARLRTALAEWVAATNARDISKLVTFYMPEVKAFYLTRNVTRSFIRTERTHAFKSAELIEVRAEEPEIIFLDGGQRAIMRFRKQYATETGGRRRQGEVVQELRWQRTATGWRIFSERDVKVIR
jgi:ketosteroid isomerase-like protein